MGSNAAYFSMSVMYGTYKVRELRAGCGLLVVLAALLQVCWALRPAGRFCFWGWGELVEAAPAAAEQQREDRGRRG
jgi:hypothetical protein